MTFASREEAGAELGQRLEDQGIKADIVLGLPRGGVVVAAEVAHILGLPLGVLVVRKIGHPRHREFAVGALAEEGVVLLDRNVLTETHVYPAELDEIIEEESMRLSNYKARFHQAGEQPLADKTVIIVDDGLATGSTAEAAVMSAKKQKASKVIVAVPVASPDAYERLSQAASEVVALLVDPDFVAVGQYYIYFPQTTDEEVNSLLHPAHA